MDDQIKVFLVWLVVSFFLQLIFEKMFKNKNYSLLTVFVVGLLLTFFTANYLLGRSVTDRLIELGVMEKSEERVSLTLEEQLARERTLFEEEKREREAEAARTLAEARERAKQEAERQRREAQLAKERRAREVKEAQVRDEIARLQTERNKLREEAIPREIAAQIAEVNKQLEELKTTASQPSELKATSARNGEMSSASPAMPQEPGAPIDDQRRLVLSGLWLGACFFIQRVFEKLFKDKGYALLTVCAAGFLLAFFTANYFLLGGSVTGGLMGAAGDRT